MTNLNDGEEPSPNERFILHTDTKPKTAKAVTLSDISGDCVTVSWRKVSVRVCLADMKFFIQPVRQDLLHRRALPEKQQIGRAHV